LPQPCSPVVPEKEPADTGTAGCRQRLLIKRIRSARFLGGLLFRYESENSTRTR